jgi:catechol 2,3-dioxygenase-like lactoylglutathione lyase family enzyme
MTVKLGYAIHFVADMDRAVAFYRDTLGLTLKFASPGWTEFATGETTLALHPASAQNPAGSTHLGFVAENIDQLYRELAGKGVAFTRVPTPEHGVKLAEFVDTEGARCSLSG